ncbi:MAG: hypothetical protein WA874_13230 [Chryseosolibacter sp.]
MNRDFYFHAKLFLGLGVAVGLITSILYLSVGLKLYGMDSFLGWYIVANLITIAGAIFLLKYYQLKEYWLAFSTGILGVISHIFIAVILVVVLVSRQMESYYLPATIFGLGTGILYGLTLIISKAGRSPLLKAAGVVICALSVIYGVVLSMSQPGQVNETLLKVDQWTSLVRNVIPLLFMLQFSREHSLLKDDVNAGPGKKSAEHFLAPVSLIAFLLTIGFGFMIVRDGIGSVVWGGRNAARAMALMHKAESRTYVGNSEDSLRYLLLKPHNYDPKKRYPLVVCLPYGGYQSPPADLLSTDKNREKYPAFLFIPYRNEGASWGGLPEQANMIPQDELVFEALEALKDEGIDRKRIYVSGVSMGGYGSWHFICSRPGVFAAAIPVCGAGDPELASRIVDVPVWAFHGAQDRGVPVSGSRDMIAAIKSAGGNPKYTEFGHKGHNIWNEVSDTPELLEWLFAQRKE